MNLAGSGINERRIIGKAAQPANRPIEIGIVAQIEES